MDDESANLKYLEKHLPNNWWTRSLTSTTDQRINEITKSALLAPDSALCKVCRSLDWEYVLFGSTKSGFKRAFAETACLGLRSTVVQKARSGCPFCAGILTALLDDIDNWYQNPETSQGCVHLDVSEPQTQELAIFGHRSFASEPLSEAQALPRTISLGV